MGRISVILTQNIVTIVQTPSTWYSCALFGITGDLWCNVYFYVNRTMLDVDKNIQLNLIVQLLPLGMKSLLGPSYCCTPPSGHTREQWNDETTITPQISTPTVFKKTV